MPRTRTEEISPLISTRLSQKELERVQSLVDSGLYMNMSDFVREAVREKLESIKIIEMREIDLKIARKDILNYLEKNKGVEIYPDEIMEDLGIDIEVVFKVLEELRKEGRIEE